MLEKERAKKFVSIGTHNQLTKLLYTLEHVTAPRDISKAKASLREVIGKLFTYKEIFELHDDHILELAETVVGLYPEREDLDSYLFYILEYLESQILKYEQIKNKYITELSIKTKLRENETDPDGYLNLKYKTWTYTTGYYHQKVHMCRLLAQVLRDLSAYAKGGQICRKRKDT